MPEINTLSSIARELKLQSGSTIKVKPIGALTMMEVIDSNISAGVTMPEALYDNATLERWFDDPEHRHQVKLAMVARYQESIKRLVHQVVATSKPILCDVTGLDESQLRELTALDWVNICRLVVDMLDTKTFAESLVAFFSDLGDLGVLLKQKTEQLKGKTQPPPDPE